jgi:hypothetical protein
VVLTGALAVGGLGGGGFALSQELTRKPTQAEIGVAATKELAQRWRTRTAAEIFPQTVSYSTDQSAHRIGIAPMATCAEALDPRIAQVLIKSGCSAVLRATYADATGTVVGTIGIAVLPDYHAADAAHLEINTSTEQFGVRAVGFSGTAAAKFGDAQRQHWAMAFNEESYVYFVTVGWVDGRATLPVAQQVPEPSYFFALGLLVRLETGFVLNSDACRSKGIRC